MSDEEEERHEEEEEEEEAHEEAAAEEEPHHEEEEEVVEEKPKPRRPATPEPEEKQLTEAEKAMLAAKKKHEEEEAMKMMDYEERRRLEKEREDEELRVLKEKQEKRKAEREAEEAEYQERRKMEEERRRKDEEDRKAKAEEKKKAKEEEKRKRLALMAGQFGGAGEGPNYKIPEKAAEGHDLSGAKPKKANEPTLSPEQLEEMKKRVLADLCKPLKTEGVDLAELRKMVKEFHARIAKLEADRYDLEMRKTGQEYEFKELQERQKQQARQQAIKKGMDPDAASSKYPPKISVASKFDRQIDRRNYGERREMYKPKARPSPKVFHGSARPPSEWGRHEIEELENLRKNMEGITRYQEIVKIEGAKPPMAPVPVQPLPQEDAPAAEPVAATA